MIAAPTGNATTDRANIQAALDQAKAIGSTASNTSGNSTVRLQRGKYVVESGFDLTGHYKLNLLGEGMMTTFVELTGTGHLFFGTATSDSTDGRNRIAHMGLLGNASSGNGIDLTYFAPQNRFEHLYIREFADGIKLSNCYESHVQCVMAALCRGWGFNFNRQNDSTLVLNCEPDSCGTGGIRIADGFQGPVVGGKTNACPIGVLIENTTNAGSGAHALTTGPKIVGFVVEGGASQTSGIRIQSAVATKVKAVQLHAVSLISGAGTLLSIDESEGLVATGLHTKGSNEGGSVTSAHIALTADAANTIFEGLVQEQAASETLFSDSGANTQRHDKDGFSLLKTFANLDVFMAKGDAQPQIGLSRNANGNPSLAAGAGGSSVVDTRLRRDAAGVWKVENVLRLNVAVAAASVPNDSIFKDSADNKIKIKDSGGTVRALY